MIGCYVNRATRAQPEQDRRVSLVQAVLEGSVWGVRWCVTVFVTSKFYWCPAIRSRNAFFSPMCCLYLRLAFLVFASVNDCWAMASGLETLPDCLCCCHTLWCKIWCKRAQQMCGLPGLFPLPIFSRLMWLPHFTLSQFLQLACVLMVCRQGSGTQRDNMIVRDVAGGLLCMHGLHHWCSIGVKSVVRWAGCPCDET